MAKLRNETFSTIFGWQRRLLERIDEATVKGFGIGFGDRSSNCEAARR